MGLRAEVVDCSHRQDRGSTMNYYIDTLDFILLMNMGEYV